MRKLLLLFIMLTACNSESMIPLDNPGKITAHLKLIELPYGQHDTLKVGSINSIFYFLHKAAEPFNCLEQDNLA